MTLQLIYISERQGEIEREHQHTHNKARLFISV